MKKFVKLLFFFMRFYRCMKCALKECCPQSLLYNHNGEFYVITVQKKDGD